ncbi:hypothetical protein [Simplicispira psychrophila]|nr:hypothetical protein [Simplicispira psychrophila]
MFNGDTLNCRGWLTYRKAGRAGLVFVEAELAYEQSLEAKKAG